MKQMRTGASIALAIASIAAAPAARAAAGPSDTIAQALHAMGAPGAEVIVVNRGTVSFQRAFGVRNVDTHQPVDSNTRFEIGSITKQITAACIVQLKERGKLSLSDKLGKYVPEYPRGKNVTIEQLLWQVSGIPNYTEVPDFMNIATSRSGSFDAILALVKNTPLDFAPGTQWAYSNTNYILLGRIVERVSGMSWSRYVRTHIFVPAGMTQSSFMEEEARIPDMATGYYAKNSALSAAPSFGAWASSAGAIVSTASDLAKWDAAFFGGKIVSLADVRLMTSAGHLANGKPTTYGFGWVVDRYAGQDRIWHNGGTFGFGASNDTYPQFGQRIIVLVNDSSVSPDAIASDVLLSLHPQLAAKLSAAAIGENPAITAEAQVLWTQFTSGSLDRSKFTPDMNKAITPQVEAAARTQFSQLGTATKWVYRGSKRNSGVTTYAYRVTYSTGVSLNVYISLTKDGKIAGYLASPN